MRPALLLPLLLHQLLAAPSAPSASWCAWHFADCLPSAGPGRCDAVDSRECACDDLGQHLAAPGPSSCPGPANRRTEGHARCLEATGCPIRGEWCPWTACDPQTERRERHKCCHPTSGLRSRRVWCSEHVGGGASEPCNATRAAAAPDSAVMLWETGGGLILVIIAVIVVVRLLIAQHRSLVRAGRPRGLLSLCQRLCRRPTRHRAAWTTLPDADDSGAMETSFGTPDAFPNPSMGVAEAAGTDPGH